MHASLLGFCHESFVIGDDILGQMLRCVRGIEVSDESLLLDVMTSVCLDGLGHYLGADQTLKLMQTKYIYPSLSDRTSPNQWQETGRPDPVSRARMRKEAILAAAQSQIDPALDQAIRARLPIHI